MNHRKVLVNRDIYWLDTTPEKSVTKQYLIVGSPRIFKYLNFSYNVWYIVTCDFKTKFIGGVHF